MKKQLLLIGILTFLLVSTPALANKVEDYTLDGETLGKEITYIEKNAEYHVYKLNSLQSPEERITLVLDNKHIRVKDKKIVSSSTLALLTKEYVDKNYPDLENSFNEAYDNLRDLESKKRPVYDIMSKVEKAIEGEYVDLCVSVPEMSWLKICLGETIKDLIKEKYCDIFWSSRCLDWRSALENFRRLRGDALELNSDNKIYQDEVQEFYKVTIVITKFLEAIDNNIATSFSKYHILENYKEFNKEAGNNPEKIEQRVQKLKTDLLGKKKELQDQAELVKENVTIGVSEGYLDIEDYKKICQIKEAIPSDEMYDLEEFSEIKSKISKARIDLDNVKNDLNNTPHKKANIFKRVLARLSLFFRGDC